MLGANAYTRTVCRAIEILGGSDHAAKEFGISVAEIEDWAAGRADPPPAAFLKAIDIVAHGGRPPRSASKS